MKLPFAIVSRRRIEELKRKETRLRIIYTEMWWFSEFDWFLPLKKWITGDGWAVDTRKEIRNQNTQRVK